LGVRATLSVKRAMRYGFAMALVVAFVALADRGAARQIAAGTVVG
jgi:hypothetical protein